MVSLVSEIKSTCQCISLLLSLVREISFMIWKVVTLTLTLTWIVLLPINLRITIMLIMTMSYEGTLVSF